MYDVCDDNDQINTFILSLIIYTCIQYKHSSMVEWSLIIIN